MRKTKKNGSIFGATFERLSATGLYAPDMRRETILAPDKPVLGARPEGHFHLTGSTGKVAVDKRPRGNVSTNLAFRNGTSKRFVNAHRQQRLVVGFD